MIKKNEIEYLDKQIEKYPDKRFLKEIKKKYENDDFFCCIVEGEQGYGMSMYHTRVMAHKVLDMIKND